MKSIIPAVCLALCAAPLAAAAQERQADPTPRQNTRSEGYTDAQRLNAEQAQKASDAHVADIQAAAAQRSEQAARDRAYSLELARHNQALQAYEREQAARNATSQVTAGR